MPITVLQLSDLHLFADPAGSLLNVRTAESLVKVIETARLRHPKPDLVLVTGDVSHDQTEESYRAAGKILESLEAPVYCLPGNHDDPDRMARVLAGGRVRFSNGFSAGGWQFVLLNSNIPGENGGHVAEPELARLASALNGGNRVPTVVSCHHNPLKIDSTWLDTMVMDNGPALFEAIDRHPHVKAVVFGHVHQAYDGRRNGTRLLAAPSTCIQFLPKSADFKVDAALPGYRWMTLHPDGVVETGVQRVEGYRPPVDIHSSGY